MSELESLKKFIIAKRERISMWKDNDWYAAMDAAYENIQKEIDSRLLDDYQLDYFGFKR